MVLIPVIAQRVDVTAESTPPETPTTKVEIPLESAYSLIHSAMRLPKLPSADMVDAENGD